MHVCLAECENGWPLACLPWCSIPGGQTSCAPGWWRGRSRCRRWFGASPCPGLQHEKQHHSLQHMLLLLLLVFSSAHSHTLMVTSQQQQLKLCKQTVWQPSLEGRKLSLAGAATIIMFVAKNTCFVATKLCLLQQNVCRNKHVTNYFCHNKFCRGKHTFVATKDMFCHDFVHFNIT